MHFLESKQDSNLTFEKKGVLHKSETLTAVVCMGIRFFHSNLYNRLGALTSLG